ncbi:hypothetical protein Acsp03_29490 [Actinomadura sp. NBRC 104412]|uniref:DoxX family protein n=1 Tax=Actinomadura sp. NBRC 104412 TaxID=3032203 RepID=UPI0024A18617|nr:DoxX family membrane protein [Actinomadura sp. NBRC 104412]GLZ05483.1 hypothetical protein Acsp03_29490 [Actinomadura sp. NBRC 104412]
MRPITTLARPLVAAPYIITGLETLRDPGRRAERVGPAVKPVADRVEWLPKDPETLVRIEGAISLGTGMLLLTGRFGRLTSLMLAAQLVPAVATEHRFWTEDDPERRDNERSHLLKNASLLGALLMVATEPRRAARTADMRRAVKEARTRAAAETRAMRRERAAELRNVRREAARRFRKARRHGTPGSAIASRAAVKAAKAAGKGRTAGMGGAVKVGKVLIMAKAAGIGRRAAMRKAGGRSKGGGLPRMKGGMNTMALSGRGKRRGRMSGMASVARIAKVAGPAGTKASATGMKAASMARERGRQAAKALTH